MSGQTLVSAYVPLPGGAEAVYNSSKMSGQTKPYGRRVGKLATNASLTISTLLLVTLTAACQNSKPQRRSAATKPAAAAQEEPCFAYLHGGDLWLQCGGMSTQVTHTGRVLEFAVAGAYLAIEDDFTVARLYSLPSGQRVRTLPAARGAYRLWVSCGKLWAQDRGGGAAVSLPAGQRPSAVPCMNAIPPDARLYDYAISPEGRYVAYSYSTYEMGDHWMLCLAQIHGVPSCFKAYEGGGVSVSDSGIMLLDAATHDGCLTNGVGAVIPMTTKPPPGFEQGIACSAIFMWSPAGGRQGPLVEYSTQPQWLAPAEAAALRTLAASPAARLVR
ncbi:MAG TPA: hypothetical protein VIE13_03450 [Terriglobales bacterium]